MNRPEHCTKRNHQVDEGGCKVPHNFHHPGTDAPGQVTDSISIRDPESLRIGHHALSVLRDGVQDQWAKVTTDFILINDLAQNRVVHSHGDGVDGSQLLMSHGQDGLKGPLCQNS